MSPILGTVASQFSGKSFGSFESIATATWTGGTYAPIVFTSIPQTFKHLQVRYICRDVGSSGFGNGGIAFNSSSGVNSASHILKGDGSSATAAADSGNSYFMYGLLGAMNSTGAGTFATGIIDILDYTNTSKNKTIRAFSGGDNNGSGTVQLTSGLTASTTAISSITFYTPSNGWANNTQFALYGIKG
jgi:hypothetical protein